MLREFRLCASLRVRAMWERATLRAPISVGVVHFQRRNSITGPSSVHRNQPAKPCAISTFRVALELSALHPWSARLSVPPRRVAPRVLRSADRTFVGIARERAQPPVRPTSLRAQGPSDFTRAPTSLMLSSSPASHENAGHTHAAPGLIAVGVPAPARSVARSPANCYPRPPQAGLALRATRIRGPTKATPAFMRQRRGCFDGRAPLRRPRAHACHVCAIARTRDSVWTSSGDVCARGLAWELRDLCT